MRMGNARKKVGMDDGLLMIFPAAPFALMMDDRLLMIFSVSLWVLYRFHLCALVVSTAVFGSFDIRACFGFRYSCFEFSGPRPSHLRFHFRRLRPEVALGSLRQDGGLHERCLLCAGD